MSLRLPSLQARRLLARLALDVEPLMKKHGLEVTALLEMAPAAPHLTGTTVSINMSTLPPAWRCCPFPSPSKGLAVARHQHSLGNSSSARAKGCWEVRAALCACHPLPMAIVIASTQSS